MRKKKEDFVNNRYCRVVPNFTAQERCEFTQDVHYKPKVENGKKKLKDYDYFVICHSLSLI